MIGPISLVLLGTGAAAVILTRRSPDRLVQPLAWYVALSLAGSMLVHWTQHGPDTRSTALMWLDCLSLYLVGLATVCRWQWSPWLYGLLAATALECAAHLLYVLGLVGGDQHTLALHVLFLCQVGSLLLGRTAPPQEDLRAPLVDMAAA